MLFFLLLFFSDAEKRWYFQAPVCGGVPRLSRRFMARNGQICLKGVCVWGGHSQQQQQQQKVQISSPIHPAGVHSACIRLVCQRRHSCTLHPKKNIKETRRKQKQIEGKRNILSFITAIIFYNMLVVKIWYYFYNFKI